MLSQNVYIPFVIHDYVLFVCIQTYYTCNRYVYNPSSSSLTTLVGCPPAPIHPVLHEEEEHGMSSMHMTDDAWEIRQKEKVKERMGFIIEKLVALMNASDSIWKTDEEERSALGTTLDDIPCINSALSLKHFLKRARDASAEVIGNNMNLAALSKEIQDVRESLDHYVTSHQLVELSNELNSLKAKSVSQRKVDKLLHMKASSLEVKELRDLVMNKSFESFVGGGLDEGEQGQGVPSGMIQLLQRKWQEVSDQVSEHDNELKLKMNRDEISAALRTLTLQLKQLKQQNVDKDKFQLMLDEKADRSEVRSVISRLAKLAEEEVKNGASGMSFNTRCLSCKRPFTSSASERMKARKEQQQQEMLSMQQNQRHLLTLDGTLKYDMSQQESVSALQNAQRRRLQEMEEKVAGSHRQGKQAFTQSSDSIFTPFQSHTQDEVPLEDGMNVGRGNRLIPLSSGGKYVKSPTREVERRLRSAGGAGLHL